MINGTGKNLENANEYVKTEKTKAVQMETDFYIHSLDGIMRGKKGDYLCEVLGDRYVVKKHLFEKIYKKS